MNADASNADAPFGAAEIGTLAHLYRGEMYRSKIWRTRLDATTNWAVVTTGIALSVAFSRADASPLPIVLVSLLVTVFLIYETRRDFRFLWSGTGAVRFECHAANDDFPDRSANRRITPRGLARFRFSGCDRQVSKTTHCPPIARRAVAAGKHRRRSLGWTTDWVAGSRVPARGDRDVFTVRY